VKSRTDSLAADEVGIKLHEVAKMLGCMDQIEKELGR